MFQHPTRPINANASGLLPEPMAADSRRVGSLRNATVIVELDVGTQNLAAAGGQQVQRIIKGGTETTDRMDHVVLASNGGQLTPEWVEWLMGPPMGWTEFRSINQPAEAVSPSSLIYYGNLTLPNVSYQKMCEAKSLRSG